jgi:acyl-coenzyme A thioesterase 9
MIRSKIGARFKIIRPNGLRAQNQQRRNISKGSNGLPLKYSVKPALSSNRLYLEKRREGNPKLFNIISRAALSLSSSTSSDQPKKKIPEKTMQESYVEEFLRFSSDPSVKEDYINMYGAIRIGKVLEDLDAIAGSIAYLHCDDGGPSDQPLGVTIVTASVDRMDLGSPIPPDKDIKLSGHVTRKISLEI